MHPEVVEVVARLGDTIIDLAHVPPTSRYRIGSDPGVELAVAAGALRAFPVLDAGFIFRRPAGFDTRVIEGGAARLLDNESMQLRRGTCIELAVGLVVLELRVVAAPREVVPRRPIDLRPAAYIAAMLIVHLVVWMVAMLRAPIERLPLEVAVVDAPRVRVEHVEVPPPKPPPQKQTKEKQAQQSAASAGGGAAGAEAPKAPGFLAATGLSDLSALIPTVDVAKLVGESVFYDEDAALAKQFGGGARFDPSKKKGWGTVKSGRYATVSSGRGAGDNFELPGGIRHAQPDIAMRPLHVAGETAKEVIYHAVDLRLGAIGYCYQRFAVKQLRGTLRIDWTIGIDGVVRDQHTSGMPEFAKCAADVIGVIPYDPATVPTAVSYAFAFTPSS